MAAYKYTVKWDVKFTAPKHNLYGVLVTKSCKFPDANSANKFAMAIQSKLSTEEQLVGKPVLEAL